MFYGIYSCRLDTVRGQLVKEYRGINMGKKAAAVIADRAFKGSHKLTINQAKRLVVKSLDCAPAVLVFNPSHPTLCLS